MKPVIETARTARLRLRELHDGDADYLLQALNEPSFIEFIGDRGVRDLDGARRYLRERVQNQYATHGFGLWAIERLSDAQVLGMCGLIRRDSLPDVDIGYALLERHWNQGYAREAAAAVLSVADRTLKLPRVMAITAPENERSQALLRDLGFRWIEERDLPEGRSAVFVRER